jgi:type IV pilus biogenesis protein CpaD/CtpE
MLHRRIVLIAALALAAACSPPQQPKQEDAPIPDPAEVIRPLYERYMTDPAATTFPTLEEQAPWSASMRQALVDMMARSQAANEPILDADPFVLAQDWQISAVAVSTDAVSASSHAVVRARFVNIDQPREVLFDMVWEGDGWRVDNIRSEGFDLREVAGRQP